MLTHPVLIGRCTPVAALTVAVPPSAPADRVHDTFVAHGIPVIMGEYALFGIDPNFPGIIEPGEVRKLFESSTATTSGRICPTTRSI